MKADFEKGTKVCSKCKRELPISEFWKDRSGNDGLQYSCKKCVGICNKEYLDKHFNTFGRIGNKRGNNNMLVRDYELTEEQLNRRERQRSRDKRYITKRKAYGLLIWYDGRLNDKSSGEYLGIMSNEYNKQKRCAIRGCVGRVKPSEHFLFDFDLEQMLKDNVYCSSGKKRYYITKWWDGEIRHWTVNDGIWRIVENVNTGTH